MTEGRAQRIAENRERHAAFFLSLAARRTCFSWGDADGVTPSEDRWGAVLAPFAGCCRRRG
jgi:hypothetical protein